MLLRANSDSQRAKNGQGVEVVYPCGHAFLRRHGYRNERPGTDVQSVWPQMKILIA